jgi:AraC-like DNA-binding protein
VDRVDDPPASGRFPQHHDVLAGLRLRRRSAWRAAARASPPLTAAAKASATRTISGSTPATPTKPPRIGAASRTATPKSSRIPNPIVVLSALAGRIPRGNTTLAAVARSLGSSPRSLQRRLKEEGTSYQEVLDEVRREAAQRYLGSSALSCSEMGYLLGFSEPAAFTRALKRWRGTTPIEFRRTARRR